MFTSTGFAKYCESIPVTLPVRYDDKINVRTRNDVRPGSQSTIGYCIQRSYLEFTEQLCFRTVILIYDVDKKKMIREIRVSSY